MISICTMEPPKRAAQGLLLSRLRPPQKTRLLVRVLTPKSEKMDFGVAVRSVTRLWVGLRGHRTALTSLVILTRYYQ